MTQSLQEQYSTFNNEFGINTLGKSKEEIKKDFPKHLKINAKVQDVMKKAESAITSWKECPRGALGTIKKKISWLSRFSTLSPLLKLIGADKDKLIPRDQGDDKYEFAPDTEEEKALLTKKAKSLNILAKVALVVGLVLITGGILLPVAAPIVLIALPEIVAIVSIVALTIIGVAGVGFVVSHPLIKNSKFIREHRAKTDIEFQKFVNNHVQTDAKGDDPGYKMKDIDVLDSGLHKIYLDWEKGMKEAFTKKNIAKLEKEKGNA